MKRSQQRRQRLFWLLSLLVVLSMIGGSLLVILADRAPAEPTPGSWLPWARAAGEPLIAALANWAGLTPLGM